MEVVSGHRNLAPAVAVESLSTMSWTPVAEEEPPGEPPTPGEMGSHGQLLTVDDGDDAAAPRARVRPDVMGGMATVESVAVQVSDLRSR